MGRRKSFVHVRTPSLTKSLAARTSPARAVCNLTGIKAPRGYGWLTNPKKAAYNRLYARRTVSLFSLLGKLFRS